MSTAPTPSERLGRSTEPSAPPYGRVEMFLRFCVVGLVMIPATLLCVLACLLMLPWRRHRILAGNAYGKVVGRTVQRVMGIIPEIHGFERIEASRPAIYVMNHAATIDMWIGMWICPYSGCGTAKKEIVRVPVFGLAYLASGHLLLDRSNRERAIASMNAVQQIVEKHGLSMFVWPEGTRSRDGRLQPFKKGFAHLALATKLPIVPIVAHDADLFWPGRTFALRPGRLQMEILPALPTTHWTEEALHEGIAEVEAAFAAVLSARQQPAPR